MSLKHATDKMGLPIPLDGEPPYRCVDLTPLRRRSFRLPCGDPFLRGRGTADHVYLDASKVAWDEHETWMDFLDVGSPAYALKRTERDLCLHWWGKYVGPVRLLDVACGIGRFTQVWLDAGATVYGVDADLKSLRRCAWHAIGRDGALDLFWTSSDQLPETGPVDVVLAAEFLCYLKDPLPVVKALADRLVPGGAFLTSVEARWGWATAEDTPVGGLKEALDGTGVLDIVGDRWVRTYEAHEVRALLEAAGLVVEELVPIYYVLDGPLEKTVAPPYDLDQMLAAEERCRNHPVWAPLNRLWLAVARKP